jgi:hypothetical protein
VGIQVEVEARKEEVSQGQIENGDQIGEEQDV